MRRLDLCLLVSGVLAFSACGGSSNPPKDGGAGKGGHSGSGGASGSGGTSGSGGESGSGGTSGSGGEGGAAGMDAGMDVATDTPATDTPVDRADTGDGGGMDALSPEAMRGQYLVSVLGCSGCHTPQKTGDAGTGPDLTRFLSGVDCFAKDTATNGCLGSANLTPDPTGIKSLTDQQVINAFTKGIDPESTDGGTIYLFANMPWYQFTNLSNADAMAIVAYLRSLTPVQHAEVAPTGFFATPLTAPQWTPITLASLPDAVTADGGADGGGSDAGTASTTNGKYFASLLCVTCHTVNTSATSPLMLDATKAYQGGRTATVSVVVPVDGGADGGDGGSDAATTMTVSKQIESANLTPDVTGLAAWTSGQISTAITTAKDNMGRSICGMRANAAIKAQDATDIANYLQAIPAVANTPAPTCY